MNFQDNVAKYAQLTVQVGVNVQEGQTLLIRTPLTAAPFVREVVKEAYAAGAKTVIVEWEDQDITRIRLEQEPIAGLESAQEWRIRGYEELAQNGCALLSIETPHPTLLEGVPADRVALATRTRRTAMRTFNQYVQSDKVSWSIVAVPTETWAKAVFPNLPIEEGLTELWNQVFSITRVTADDVVGAWNEHVQDLQARADYLTREQFAKLVYTAPGTELTIELPDNHVWLGGGSTTPEGNFFLPNIPTEEVFTVPKRDGVHGTVSSTRPLNYDGQVIDKFSLTFEQGRIVRATAEVGEEALNMLIESDEGAHFLGEVALVPDSSPISQSGLVFQSTLYDENASCHLAIGACYPICFEEGSTLSEADLQARGGNISIIHEDFMVGSSRLQITAIRKNGERFTLMKDGNWSFSV